MNVPTGLADYVKDNDDFSLFVHVSPDGDAIGAALAISGGIAYLGKKVSVYSRDKLPDMYDYLPGIKQVKLFTELNGMEASTLVLVDCNKPERAGIEGIAFKSSIVIDHHLTESGFGDIKWVETESPATGLMAYYFLKHMGVPITEDMAVQMYTAIAVDTGTFRFSSTTAETLRVASELVSLGVKPSFIADRLYNNWSEGRFMLLQRMLGSLEIHDKTAIAFVTGRMMHETGTRSEDTEDFVNFPIMVDTIKVSVLLREVGEGLWKGSLRSHGDVNVSEVAALLGGGGHRNAAGFRVAGDAQSARTAVLECLAGVTRGGRP
ncbi:MAG: bifunctional oligoribonuclease/PAP phosphatase NrnA [Nitrospirae bacterium]|nr:bifunctional oligoribonuclease/PAP phosphatase NrnA [Nitrospirota bacterium]